MSTLKIKNLSVSSQDGQELLKSIDFTVEQGELIVVYGPNGAGKSSLLKAIMHHFNTKINKGDIIFNNKSIKNLDTCTIAKLGFFHMQQNPLELNGVQTLGFLRLINGQSQNKLNFADLFAQIQHDVKELSLPDEILSRELNVDFSGGQKKKTEILQARVFQPTVLLIDEIDSGLDVEAIKKISDFINTKRKDVISIVVSHNNNFIKLIKPSRVLVLNDKKIVHTGTAEVINKIETNGFGYYIKNEVKSKRPQVTCLIKK
ncbi:MAG: ATP-binding cassette domain-containing protein [Mycoplasmataceae bacterium]|jgi:Fe-S cluster assembly ATP-binding protein|nr:ATP-binding cassette domain-containing protein [Mycoplasmataceae bacterium]